MEGDSPFEFALKFVEETQIAQIEEMIYLVFVNIHNKSLAFIAVTMNKNVADFHCFEKKLGCYNAIFCK